MSMAVPAIVLLGTPFTAIDAFGRGIADAVDGVWLGDLHLSMASSVGELLQFYAVAQVPLHEPMHALLRRQVPEAADDPDAFLQARADWTTTLLLEHLMARVGRPLVCCDLGAGFRVHQVERWFAMRPEALFVHVTHAIEPFVEAATRFYGGQLFVPPDFRDHCHDHPQGIPVLDPALAWYQVHLTLVRAFADNGGMRRCRIALETPAPKNLAALETLAETQSAAGLFSNPYVANRARATAPTLAELESWLLGPASA